jgi:hypothetical protein
LRVASSEAELYARVGSLDRGWNSPEGAPSLRARQELTRGGVKPSSEAGVSCCSARPSSETEVHSRGTGAGCLMGR